MRKTTWQPFLQQQQESVALRDKTTASNQLAVASDGSIIISAKGSGAPPGRSAYFWTVDQFAFATTAEAVLTVTESLNGAATGTFTSRVITSGKTIRIDNVIISLEQTGGTPIIMRCYVGIRINTAGTATTSSPLIFRHGLSVAGTVKTIATCIAAFPDGMEILGDGTKQIAVTAITPDYFVTTQLTKLSISIEVMEY